MKTSSWIASLPILFLSGAVLHQRAEPGTETVVERGPHHNVVATTRIEAGPDGQSVTVQGRYIQLEDGLNYWDEPAQAWAEAKAEIELVKGVAVARRGQQQVLFAPNVNDEDGAITLTAAGGVTLRSSILALAYYDAQSGRDAVLAVVKDAVGELLPPNRIIYRDAFEGLEADVVYTYRKSGLEQDVILRVSPPDPEAFGLLAEATRLEVLTEFFEAPAPKKQARLLDGVKDAKLRAAMAEPDWEDEELDFGSLRMAEGRALSLGDWLEGRVPSTTIPVGKRWEQADGRIILFESADYWSLASELGQLPTRDGQPRKQRQAHAGSLDRASRLAALVPEPTTADKHLAQRTVPRRALVTASAQPQDSILPETKPAIQVASTTLDARPGFVLDYQTLTGTLTDYTFRAYTTYLINGPVTLSGSTATFEGGTVLKYAAGVSAKVTLNSATKLVWRGGFHKPVIFTAKDDHGVGEKIGTATSISGYYATTALELTYNATYGPFNLGWLRVAHAQNGISVTGGSGHAFRHVQMVNCDKGIVTSGATSYAVRNALFAGVNKALSGTSTVTAEHLTVNGGALRDTGQPAVTLKNSLLTGVSDVGTGYGADSQVLPNNNGVFQAVQQGAHYLAAGSPYRNWPQALTTIDAGLLTDLRKLTTYPPVVLGGDFTVSTTLSPQAQRDTDTLDLGYHYPPVDYLLNNRTVSTGCILLLTNGVSVAAYQTRLLTLSGTGQLVSEGLPTMLNRIGYAGAAQEQATITNAPGTLLSGANVDLRFTGLTLAGGRNFIDGAFTATVSLRDCQFAGLRWSVYGYSSSSPVVFLRNNLFESCSLGFEQGYASIPGYLALTLQHNLFARTPVTFWYSNNSYYGIWVVNDNLFDGTVTVTTGSVPASYNGFIGFSGPGGWIQNKNNLSRDFVSGPLGEYYYPSTGAAPSLASLINADTARTPASMGLYHHTTVATASSKEAATVLDIGFHYVGVNASNQPLDTDGDGLPDYFEDRDGDNILDSGETNWNSASDTGLRVWITRPASTTPTP